MRTMFTLDEELAAQARKLQLHISAAAREGVAAAVKHALAEADRAAYLRHPEESDDFWDQAQALAWGNREDDETGVDL